jgi:hypothetical protein
MVDIQVNVVLTTIPSGTMLMKPSDVSKNSGSGIQKAALQEMNCIWMILLIRWRECLLICQKTCGMFVGWEEPVPCPETRNGPREYIDSQQLL